MELENQVCNLELAKKLKELDVKQDSYWVWINPFKMGWDLKHFYDIDIERQKLIPRYSIMPSKVERPCYAAFTVAELGEMLPKVIRDNEINMRWSPSRKEWIILYGWYHGALSTNIKSISAKTEADVCAKMLIYLIETLRCEIENRDENR